MQDNVNAENVLQSLFYNFGKEAVSQMDAGIIKLQVKSLGNGDITTISNILQIADVQIKRSGNGLLILFIPKLPMDYSLEIIKALEHIDGDFNLSADSPKEQLQDDVTDDQKSDLEFSNTSQLSNNH